MNPGATAPEVPACWGYDSPSGASSKSTKSSACMAIRCAQSCDLTGPHEANYLQRHDPTAKSGSRDAACGAPNTKARAEIGAQRMTRRSGACPRLGRTKFRRVSVRPGTSRRRCDAAHATRTRPRPRRARKERRSRCILPIASMTRRKPRFRVVVEPLRSSVTPAEIASLFHPLEVRSIVLSQHGGCFSATVALYTQRDMDIACLRNHTMFGGHQLYVALAHQTRLLSRHRAGLADAQRGERGD